MKRQLSLATLTLTLISLATSVWADGWEGKRPVPLVCVNGPFAGAYVGGAVGYGQQHVKVENFSIGRAFEDTEGGATFGGYAGYNWQRCSRFVFGVEADFNYLHASPTALDIETGPTGLNETTSLDSNMDWFGTLRGRLGFVVHDHVLLYATGGLAYARFDRTLADNCVGCGNSVVNLGPFSQSNDDTRAGWTVGGGAELIHDTHWLLRAEALYMDFGSTGRTYVITRPDIGTGQLFTARAITDWDDQVWVARVGLAYKFGAREDVPLK